MQSCDNKKYLLPLSRHRSRDRGRAVVKLYSVLGKNPRSASLAMAAASADCCLFSGAKKLAPGRQAAGVTIASQILNTQFPGLTSSTSSSSLLAPVCEIATEFGTGSWLTACEGDENEIVSGLSSTFQSAHPSIHSLTRPLF